MSDLISRKKAIESLSQDQDNDYTDLYHDGYVDGKWDAIDIIKNLPSAQLDMSEYSDKLWKAAYERGKAETQQRWIPCSERSPEENTDILVTYVDGEETRIIPVNYGRGTWYDCIFDAALDPLKITAWMQLPEPYKEGVQP